MSDVAPRRIEVFVHETRKALAVGADGRTTTLRMRRGRPVRVVELPEAAAFVPGGAVLLPAPPVSGADAALGGVAAMLRYVRRSGDLLLVAGHGCDEALSAARAACVTAVLLGQADGFAAAGAQARVEEWQRILAWVAAARGWPCDPGPADGVAGKNTRAALHRFRAAFNQAHGAALALNAPLGPADWGAFLRCYDDDLARRLGDDPAGARAGVQVRGAHGCGGAWPLPRVRVDAYPGRADARVDLLAFAPADAPKVACHAGPACVPTTCDVYRKAKYHAAPLEGDADLDALLLRVRLLDHAGAPLAGRQVTVTVAGVDRQESTDGDGVLAVPVTAEVSEAHLRLADEVGGATLVVPLRVAALAPASELLGQQQRLRNLGYFMGEVEGEDELEDESESESDDALRSAVEEFQCDQGLPLTGACDAATQARLVEVHGG